MKYSKLGIPYMGSKRKIAGELVDYILENNPNCKYFYDLFGGGGAVSLEMASRKQPIKIIYNEYDSAIVELFKKIQKDGVTEEFYKWVSREEFFKYKDGKDWYSGLVKTCWSFGNRGSSYLYGKNIEEKKHLAHNIVLKNSKNDMNLFNLVFGLNLDISDIIGNTINERRLSFQRLLKKEVEDFSIFRGFCITKKEKFGNVLHHLQGIQQLERIQHLERIQQLERIQHLERIKFKNCSYDEVLINTPINETIIYCDPPYKNTGKYQNNIDHDKFNEWVKNNKYKVYISEYESIFNEFKCWNTRSTFSSTNNSKKTTEKLYCNRDEFCNEFF